MERNRLEAMRLVAVNIRLDGQSSRADCVTELCDTVAELQAEVGGLTLFKALGQKLVRRILEAPVDCDTAHDIELRLAAIIAERDQLKSWQESIRAELGPEPKWPARWLPSHDVLEAYTALANDYKHRAEHLAAKLVQTQEALQLAFNHIDTESLRISHCNDLAAIIVSLPKEPSQPLPGKQLFTDEDRRDAIDRAITDALAQTDQPDDGEYRGTSPKLSGDPRGT